ncbi:hypothetical protein FHT85_006198 [Rhizobium sp. BK312]|jgi:hypothetical protein|uniref:catalase n=1 Tax=Rhizobium sp. BK312 TaxID=2587080 RepID=UPI000DC5D86E|nr:catalase [Rhizobium sp. BK312]MBB3429166.1 hypothetical protein [Rhizobium sp. BK312]
MEDDWIEIYDGGSPEAEKEIFRQLVQKMLAVQEANRQKAGAVHARRALHAKVIAAVSNAVLSIDENLPGSLRVSHFQPGASLAATVRFSNASGIPQPDGTADMRGVAIRLDTGEGTFHDLLMTNFPVSHARNARQFVEFASIASGDRALMMERLEHTFGKSEAIRLVEAIAKGMRPCRSIALERFWSRGAILWGTVPVRFNLIPDASAADAFLDTAVGGEGLREELAARLAERELRYRLAIQHYKNELVTPIEDGAVEWTEIASPSIEIATLRIPKQDIQGIEGRHQMSAIDALAFNPWNAPAQFRPLGNLNRARRDVYGATAHHWQRPMATKDG